MGTFAQITVLGRVGGDAELRCLPTGKGVADFSVAHTETWKNAAGEKQEKTTWFKIVAWGALAENVVAKYVRKGDLVLVTGQVEVEAYLNKQGQAAASLKVTVDKLTLVSSNRARDGVGADGGLEGEAGWDGPDSKSKDDIPF